MKARVDGHAYDTDNAYLVAHLGNYQGKPRIWVYRTKMQHLFYVYERRIGQYVFKPADKKWLERCLVQYGCSQERKDEILNRLKNN